MKDRRTEPREAIRARIGRHARTCCIAALALAAPGVHAYVDHYLASTIVGTMSQSEARSFAGAVNRALTASADGGVTPWSVPATRRRPAIRATIRVLESREDTRQSCRRVRSELRRASNQESWTGWFCRQTDGRWKARIVGQ